ncbi:hypothetical protein L3Q82_013895 [Scortum barcoo]|uniref:Uncharacterized protein n=1 Tax=Scortum barcoo TaxID=214431 RepID=A0ACB8VVR8_9TELE|nr:hypothetical protein L3Q82_013895 [Scortum barcoo]
MQSLTSRLEGFIAASPSPPAAPAPPASPHTATTAAAAPPQPPPPAPSSSLPVSAPAPASWPHHRSFPESPTSLPHGKRLRLLLCSRSDRDAGGWWIMPLNSARAGGGQRMERDFHHRRAFIMDGFSRGGSKGLSGSVGHPKGLRKPSRNSLSSIDDNRLRERGERDASAGSQVFFGVPGARTPSVSFADRATCLPQYQSLPRPLLEQRNLCSWAGPN